MELVEAHARWSTVKLNYFFKRKTHIFVHFVEDVHRKKLKVENALDTYDTGIGDFYIIIIQF